MLYGGGRSNRLVRRKRHRDELACPADTRGGKIAEVGIRGLLLYCAAGHVTQEQITVVAHCDLSHLLGITAQLAPGEQGRVVVHVDGGYIRVGQAFVQDRDGDDHLHVRTEIALTVLGEYQARRGLPGHRGLDEFQLRRDQRGRLVGVGRKGNGHVVHVPVVASRRGICRDPSGASPLSCTPRAAACPWRPAQKPCRRLRNGGCTHADLPFGDRCRGVRPGCARVTGSSRWVGCSTATADRRLRCR